MFSRLGPILQSHMLDMYFLEQGLQYNMARLPIGSCDFSLKDYNYDNTSGDAGLTHFSINMTELRLAILFIQCDLKTRSGWTNDIGASPWSPPGWMKELGSSY